VIAGSEVVWDTTLAREPVDQRNEAGVPFPA